MKKIMYIDDEADSEKMASKFEIMEEEGIQALRITRVENVLPTLEKEIDNVQAIVLDIIMPPENLYSLDETNGGTTTGIRLLEDIRSKYKRVPIVIVSIKRRGHMEHIIDRFKVAEYLEKPISASELSKTINRVIMTKKNPEE